MVLFILEFIIVSYLVVNHYNNDMVDTGKDCVCCGVCTRQSYVLVHD